MFTAMIPQNLHCKLSFTLLFAFTLCNVASARTRYFNFTIQNTNVTRLCNTKSLLTVNGEFPGPTSYVREGDNVVVNVTNLGTSKGVLVFTTLRDVLCPGMVSGSCARVGRTGRLTSHNALSRLTSPMCTGFRFLNKGVLFWHAHNSWLRASLYGAFIILKRNKTPYPFPKPDQELPPLLLGEWWNENVEHVIDQALLEGAGYTTSNAITINGQPGDFYNCSSSETVVYNVTQGQTVMLRLINAAMNFHMYFAVANHSLTVVEADAEYVQPYTTDIIVLAPGQTSNVLLTANKSVGRYYIAASIFSMPNTTFVPFPTIATTAILSYNGGPGSTSLTLPIFPLANDTTFVNNFYSSLKGRFYSEGYYYYDVPKTIDVDLLHTVGYALQPCPSGHTCQGPSDSMIRASISNITFVTPNISLLQAYYNNISGVYTTNFPDVPLFQYDYTAVNPEKKVALPGTRVHVIPFNSTVQVVYQDTATLLFEQHPMHLHGQNFYEVGRGNGTFNASTDPASFNLVNPISRNTVSVPAGGWAAVRFQAVNPGVWFVHCHFDIHASWGMDMAFITLNGVGENETLPPPPADYPACQSVNSMPIGHNLI